MLASVHVADVGVARVPLALLDRPKPSGVPGLLDARTALFAPLAMKGPPPIGRVGLVTFWEDEASLDRFASTSTTLRRYEGGLHARLRPLRAYGDWPGLPEDVPRERTVPHEGPVVVLTLARLHLTQTVRFLRTSRPAEHSAVASPGFVWGSAAAKPPFVATMSVWEDSRATRTYAFGRREPAHDDAIAEQMRKDFHRESAFVRFAPVRLEGRLGGRNPIDADALGI